MSPLVAVIAPGAMGAAVAARLVENGATVLTSLSGRSNESAARAEAAGMRAASEEEIAGADFFLSIVPPGEAVALAQRFAPRLRESNRKPTYIDCNAVNPQTVADVADTVAKAGCAFVDSGIIGAPPRPGSAGPRFYVSGPDASRSAPLKNHGLDIRVMNGAIGEASALKMSYGGLTKGLTGLGAALVLAAGRAGVEDALRAELAASQPALLAYLSRSVPEMFVKAYRFVDEMDEVAAFVGCQAEQGVYEGLADLYRRLSEDQAGARQEIAALAAFFVKAKADRPS
jgi:L-threonate 2-dehydrogenase